MPAFQPVKYNSMPYEIRQAVQLTAESLELTWDGTFERRGYRRQLTAWLKRGSDGSMIDGLVFRRGDEFVCIPGVYEDEGTSFTSTRGRDYMLVNEQVLEWDC